MFNFSKKLIGYVISGGKTCGLLRGGAFGANRDHVLAHWGAQWAKMTQSLIPSTYRGTL